MMWPGWSRLIWHNFIKVASNWIKICSLTYIGTCDRCVKFGPKIFNRLGKMSENLRGDFFYLHCIRHQRNSGFVTFVKSASLRSTRKLFVLVLNCNDCFWSPFSPIDAVMASHAIRLTELHGKPTFPSNGLFINRHSNVISYNKRHCIDSHKSFVLAGPSVIANSSYVDLTIKHAYWLHGRRYSLIAISARVKNH